MLRNIRDVSPDPDLFPDFDENLREAFQQETELFFESQLREDRSVVDLLSADYTFVNERLARHYGIPNVYGDRFRRVTLTDDRRGGLLGQGSLLTVTSYPNRTSPVLRGKWLLETILGTPPPPPPPDVPALKDRGEGGKIAVGARAAGSASQEPGCAGCHSPMDPLGFALENFDAIGRWRTEDAGTPVDASGTLPSGAAFEGCPGCARCSCSSGSVRHERHRETAGLRARARHRVLRPALRPTDRAGRGAAGLSLVVDHSRHRQERDVSESGNWVIG